MVGVVAVSIDINLVGSLLFLPIDIGNNNDNGTYTCAMTLSFANSLITSSQPNNNTINVTVERKLQCSLIKSYTLSLSLSLCLPPSLPPFVPPSLSYLTLQYSSY